MWAFITKPTSGFVSDPEALAWVLLQAVLAYWVVFVLGGFDDRLQFLLPFQVSESLSVGAQSVEAV